MLDYTKEDLQELRQESPLIIPNNQRGLERNIDTKKEKRKSKAFLEKVN